jgi:hypothetical protein
MNVLQILRIRIYQSLIGEKKGVHIPKQGKQQACANVINNFLLSLIQAVLLSLFGRLVFQKLIFEYKKPG